MATEFDWFKQQLAKFVKELSNHEIIYLTTLLTMEAISRGILPPGFGDFLAGSIEQYLDKEAGNN